MKKEKEELWILLANRDELVRKVKEEEGRRQINQLSSGLNKEQQLIRSSEKGYIYGIKKLLKEGVNINAKDSYKRRRHKDGQH